MRRRLPRDWTERYSVTPVLIETLRYTGAVYRASGWTHVGTTQGRGRYDRNKLYDKPHKDVWLRPLRRDWRRALNRLNPGPRDRQACLRACPTRERKPFQSAYAGSSNPIPSAFRPAMRMIEARVQLASSRL